MPEHHTNPTIHNDAGCSVPATEHPNPKCTCPPGTRAYDDPPLYPDEDCPQHGDPRLLSPQEPTPLRWGLDDVMWGDDDSTTVMLSGPAGEPYWLELDADRTAALRELLAGPNSKQGTDSTPATIYRFEDDDGDLLHIGIPHSPLNGVPALSFYSGSEPVHVPVDEIGELIAAVRRLTAKVQQDGAK